MWMILMPVLLAIFIGPGMGQMANKEFKKGLILISVSLLVLAAYFVWFSRAAMAYVPSDISTVDKAVLMKIKVEIVKNHAGTFYTYWLMLIGLWIYGIVDAYRGGARRRAEKSAPVVQA